MKNAEIIVGPPGTGKTTELLNLVDTYLSKGVSPTKIGFVSFTRKSVEEAVARAAKRFNKNPKYFTFFRTIHSLAFYQLGMSRNDVMEKKHYQEMGESLGVIIKGKSAADYAIEELEKGDQLVFIESLSRMRCEPLQVTYERETLDFSFYELELFQKTLIKYKQVNMLHDYTDMLVNFSDRGAKPQLQVLFVDEAQDLCALQWQIINQLSANSNKTFIAGDDDQAIFRWSGADIEYFIDLSKKNKTRVLTQSYRIPTEVHSFATKLIGDVQNRITKTYKPTTHKGKIEFISSLDDIDMSNGKWLLLVRNIFMINSTIEYLRQCGYTYSSRFKSSNTIESLQAAFCWEKLKTNAIIKAEEVKKMLTYMSKSMYNGNLAHIKGDQDLSIQDLHKLGNFKNSVTEAMWYDVLDKISIEDREYFIAARRRGESLIKEPRIHVSTIHGAKGGECENVVVFTDISIKTYSAMLNNYEDEVRVFYVGITRVKENLYIVQPNTNCYFNI